jgi:hypothetical protein
MLRSKLRIGLVIVAVLTTLVACSTGTGEPSPTATPEPTATLEPTATPEPTPTPVLLTGNPRSYLPSQSEMPPGYVIEPNMSLPISDEGSSVGYTSMANAFDPSGKAMGIVFAAVVFQSEEQAQVFLSEEERFEGFGSNVGAQLRSVNVNIPNVDESVVFAGRNQGGEIGPNAFVVYAFSVKNVVSVVMSMGNGLDQDSPEGLVTETLYYVSLVTDKLKEQN